MITQGGIGVWPRPSMLVWASCQCLWVCEAESCFLTAFALRTERAVACGAVLQGVPAGDMFRRVRRHLKHVTAANLVDLLHMTISYPEPDRATLAASLLLDHDAEEVQLLHTKAAANSRRGPGLSAGQELAADGVVWVQINKDLLAAQMIASLLETSIACGNIGIMQKLLAIPAAQEISESAAAVLVGTGGCSSVLGISQCAASRTVWIDLPSGALPAVDASATQPVINADANCHKSAGADAAFLVLCRDPVLGWPAAFHDQGPF